MGQLSYPSLQSHSFEAKMQLTDEQRTIVSHVKANEGLTKISAVAGSGKTTLLTAIAKTVPEGTGLYLAYSKAVAVEAQRKFPKWVSCSTTHSLAYQSVFRPYKLHLGDFSYRAISHKVPFEAKCNIIKHIESFCLSKYTTFEAYGAEHELASSFIELCKHYLEQMGTGKIGCTHSFYLKLFHVLLSTGLVTFNTFDLVMLDEAGDLNQVTKEIFKLLPATRKIMVGDPYQNIFTFNETINGFKKLEHEGTLLPMTQSFRVSDKIASKIEKFCHKYLDPAMNFKGVPVTDETINSKLYIARTNASLITKMMELNRLAIPYGLVRKAKQIFNLHLTLISLKRGGFVAAPELKYLQDDVDTYYKDKDLQRSFKSHLDYIKESHSYDSGLVNTINSVYRYGTATILNTYEEARKHEKLNQAYMLGTSHAVKGLESDQVELADDMNLAILEIKLAIDSGKQTIEDLTEEQLTEIRLHYVACSRAKKVLLNAVHI